MNVERAPQHGFLDAAKKAKIQAEDPFDEIWKFLNDAYPQDLSTFWKNCTNLPLKCLARKTFSLTATSSGPERHFSSAGKCANPARNSLAAEKVCSQTYVCLALKEKFIKQ